MFGSDKSWEILGAKGLATRSKDATNGASWEILGVTKESVDPSRLEPYSIQSVQRISADVDSRPPAVEKPNSKRPHAPRHVTSHYMR